MADQPKSAKPDMAIAFARRSTAIGWRHWKPASTACDALLDLIDGATIQPAAHLLHLRRRRGGNALFATLSCRRPDRGVVVRLLLDGYGVVGDRRRILPADRRRRRRLLHVPAELRSALPDPEPSEARHRRRADRAIIGGANVETVYLSDEGDKYWRDLWVLIEGPAADPGKPLFRLRSSCGRQTKGAKLRTLRRIVMRHSQSEGAAAVEVQRSAEPQEPIAGCARPRA